MKNAHILVAALITCSLMLVATTPIQAADQTITDASQDVSTIDIYGEQSSYVTSSPDIDINNIDITQLTYTKVGGSAALTLSVRGVIEDRGNIAVAAGDYPENLTQINDVEYQFFFQTNLAGSL